MKKTILTLALGILFFGFQTSFGQKKKASKKSKPVTVSCGVCNQKAIFLPKPEFPEAAKFVGAKGAVSVSVLIDEKGNVIEAKAVSGNPIFRASSVKAALLAKFEPLLFGGKPTKMFGTIVYDFVGNYGSAVEKTENESGTDQLINLIKPPLTSCNCKFGEKPTVLVLAKVDGRGKITEAKAVSGHPFLILASEKAALESKFFAENIKSEIAILYSFKRVNNWSVETSDVVVLKKNKIKK